MRFNPIFFSLYFSWLWLVLPWHLLGEEDGEEDGDGEEGVVDMEEDMVGVVDGEVVGDVNVVLLKEKDLPQKIMKSMIPC